MTDESILECVPNFSEGIDASKVERIVAAMRLDGVSLLDFSRDPDHNRSVVTIAGSPPAVVEAVVRAAGVAASLIDLTRQTGAHPRIGAADVIPFVPVQGISLADCALLSRQAGMQIWRRFGVPVYFYGAAATRPDRVQLEDVRRGQFEGLREAVARDTARQPDVGGPQLHPTAGASVVGARPFLIAYNIYLQTAPGTVTADFVKRGTPSGARFADLRPSSSELAAARAIAREIRASSGGMQGVKALGVAANGQAQVTMNITDYRLTPMTHVHGMVELLANKHGLSLGAGELIGLIPEAAFDPSAAWVTQIPNFDPAEKVLERRLRFPMAWPS